MKCDEFLGMLDAFVDGELGDEARDGILEHARACEDCALELRRAQALKKLLCGLDDDINVPLQAQAAWRSAVKAEARKKRMRGLYRAMGAVAAAFVVLIGVAAGMNLFGAAPSNDLSAKKTSDTSDPALFAFVEPDGDDSIASMQAMPRSSEAAELSSTVRITADDVTAAADTVTALIDEFNGSVSERSVSAATAYITAFVPAAEYEAFTDSLSFAGTVEASRVGGASGDTVSISITIQQN